jgi:signal peptidase I
VLAEALALGALASLAGVAVGFGLAKGLDAILKAAGLDLPETGMVFATRTVLVSLGVGVGVTVLAALVPAMRATRVAPVAALTGAPPQSPRARRWAPWVAGVVSALGLALLLGAPNVVGGHAFTVMSGSMTPTILTGDVVLDERIRPLQARIGDIITFKDPRKPRLLTHRLRSVRRQGDKLVMVTKGDANNTVERWVIPVRGEVGRVRYRVPKVGRILWRTRTPQAKILLIAIPSFVLGVWQLVSIWRPKRPDRPPVAREDAAPSHP